MLVLVQAWARQAQIFEQIRVAEEKPTTTTQLIACDVRNAKGSCAGAHTIQSYITFQTNFLPTTATGRPAMIAGEHLNFRATLTATLSISNPVPVLIFAS